MVYFGNLYIYNISLHTIITNTIILWSRDKSKETKNDNNDIKSFTNDILENLIQTDKQTAPNKEEEKKNITTSLSFIESSRTKQQRQKRRCVNTTASKVEYYMYFLKVRIISCTNLH
jgi:hypothetical protein